MQPLLNNIRLSIVAVVFELTFISCSHPEKARLPVANTLKKVSATADHNPTRPIIEPDSCEELAEKMMMSTSIFKKVEADTPHWLIPEKEDGTYTFGLYHDFEDHTNTFAWIVVDLNKEQVFQHDIPTDSLIPIGFDKRLIKQINHCCH